MSNHSRIGGNSDWNLPRKNNHSSESDSRFQRDRHSLHSRKVVRVPAGVDVVQLLEVLATALLLVDAPHVFRASARELLLAQRLLRLCTHRRAIVNRHLALYITPRRFCSKQSAVYRYRSIGPAKRNSLRSFRSSGFSIISSGRCVRELFRAFARFPAAARFE